MLMLSYAASSQGIRRYARDLGSAAPLRWVPYGKNSALYEANRMSSGSVVDSHNVMKCRPVEARGAAEESG